MRLAFLACAVLGFVGLGVLDLIGGRYASGAASICLATANLLLLR